MQSIESSDVNELARVMTTGRSRMFSAEDSYFQDCRVCGNSVNNRRHRVLEMQLGLREEYEYLECSRCGCIHISNIPKDLGPYYPNEYYSLSKITGVRNEKIRKMLRRKRAEYWLSGSGTCGKLLASRGRPPVWFGWLQNAGIRIDSAILDVGSGTGELLVQMSREGFDNLHGIDPFIDRDIRYEDGLQILKADLSTVSGHYDFVMLNHSFEHMRDPLAALIKISQIMRPGGFALIRTPVASSFAWSEYGTDWAQLDAPRHLYIHTPTSIELLAREAGLILSNVIFDSNGFQFWASERYRRGIPLRSHPEQAIHTPEMLQLFETRASKLNCNSQGDQACFYLTKQSDAR